MVLFPACSSVLFFHSQPSWAPLFLAAQAARLVFIPSRLHPFFVVGCFVRNLRVSGIHGNELGYCN